MGSSPAERARPLTIRKVVRSGALARQIRMPGTVAGTDDPGSTTLNRRAGEYDCATWRLRVSLSLQGWS